MFSEPSYKERWQVRIHHQFIEFHSPFSCLIYYMYKRISCIFFVRDCAWCYLFWFQSLRYAKPRCQIAWGVKIIITLVRGAARKNLVSIMYVVCLDIKQLEFVNHRRILNVISVGRKVLMSILKNKCNLVLQVRKIIVNLYFFSLHFVNSQFKRYLNDILFFYFFYSLIVFRSKKKIKIIWYPSNLLLEPANLVAALQYWVTELRKLDFSSFQINAC